MNCFISFGHLFSEYGHRFSPFEFLVTILFVLVTVALIVWAYRLFKRGGATPASPCRDARDTMDILKTRLAKGEIDEEEFRRIRQILGM